MEPKGSRTTGNSKNVKKSKYNKRNILFEGSVHASTSTNPPWVIWMPTDGTERLPRYRELEKLPKKVKKSKYNKRNILFEGSVHASTSTNPPWVIWMPTDGTERLPRYRELNKLGKKVKKSKYNGRNLLFEGAVHASTPPCTPWSLFSSKSAVSVPPARRPG
jgi:hypothetical protein